MEHMKATLRSISASELKFITSSKTIRASISEVAKRLQKRTWKREDRVYDFSGIDWEADKVLFCHLYSVEGGAGYGYLKMSIADAIDCITGRLTAGNSIQAAATFSHSDY